MAVPAVAAQAKEIVLLQTARRAGVQLRQVFEGEVRFYVAEKEMHFKPDTNLVELSRILRRAGSLDNHVILLRGRTEGAFVVTSLPFQEEESGRVQSAVAAAVEELDTGRHRLPNYADLGACG